MFKPIQMLPVRLSSMRVSRGICLILVTIGMGSLPARTWTSADGSKTFEGTFQSYDEARKQVTVTLHTGKSVTFSINKLSQEDRKFLVQEAGTSGTTAREFAQSDLGKALANMQILADSAFTPHRFESVPDFFILYYSASW